MTKTEHRVKRLLDELTLRYRREADEAEKKKREETKRKRDETNQRLLGWLESQLGAEIPSEVLSDTGEAGARKKYSDTGESGGGERKHPDTGE